MQYPEQVWRFGLWLAQRMSGTARLSWNGREILLGFSRGKIVSIEGINSATVAQRVDRESANREELLEEAVAIAARNGMSETRTLGAAKEALQEVLAEWLLDPKRDLELIEGKALSAEGATISATHSIVELVLSDPGEDLVRSILPDLNILVRRSDNFLDLYAPLRLSEEADLVVAKITGQRTAGEIASRSPHGPQEVLRLIAALVATGMLEAEPVEMPVDEPDHLAVEFPEAQRVLKKLPLWPVVAVIFVVAIVLLILGTIRYWPRGEADPAADSVEWTLVVDMGCEPEELQRVLRKARANPKTLRPVQATAGEEDSCWRLVWGRFPTREAADDALPEIPERLVLDGFTPHAIELPPETSEDGSTTDEE
jgi:hypothetical protein